MIRSSTLKIGDLNNRRPDPIASLDTIDPVSLHLWRLLTVFNRLKVHENYFRKKIPICVKNAVFKEWVVISQFSRNISY